MLNNRFDFCVRGYSHGVYERGQDSTGILVYEQCSDNLFAQNSATHGGDGFFLYAGNETLKESGEGGCNRNIVLMNDFSHAVANGIEATFSDQNVFVGNRLNHCRHGMWGGYSRNSLIAFNEISGCRNGVSIEHGRGNILEQNVFRDNRRGVHFWWDEDADLLGSVFGLKQGGASTNESIRSNVFERCATGIATRDSTELEVSGNLFEECERVARLAGGTTLTEWGENALLGGVIENETGKVMTGSHNYIGGGVRVAGGVDWMDEAGDLAEVSGGAMKLETGACDVVAETCKRVQGWHLPQVEALVATRGTMPEPLPRVPQGKANILVDEWGPFDFQSVKVHPSRGMGWGSMVVQVLGPATTFEATVVEGDVRVTPASGMTPSVVTIERVPTDSGCSQFAVRFVVGDAEATARGMLVRADWDVNFYGWSRAVDPRGDMDAWERIISAEPIHREQTGKIDYTWGGWGPKLGAAGDHFAVVATSEMTLPAGRWKLRTVSDDGVRVFVDGAKVIDNWTWHVPTEDVAEVDLADGAHVIRIEYFEIDGHAQLQFFVEPV
ncbi:MAG: hypothetical protein GY851_32875, partial [bacterium]|nr:hypothetical protein [bacterium]